MVPELLTVRQTAEKMQTSMGHVYRLISTGYLEAVNISPMSKRPCLRVTRNVLVTFLEKEQKAEITPKQEHVKPNIRKLRKKDSISNRNPSFKTVPPGSKSSVATLLQDGM